MNTKFEEMNAIFTRTKTALIEFMEIITPIIEHTTDDHERLYWHHIYEEEEHRSDRLDLLLPKLREYLQGEKEISSDHFEFVYLLQDISLEKFGLHNFLEHLDLSLFQFNGTEYEGKIRELRDLTYEDYQQMKVMLEELNEELKGEFDLNTSIPTDEKEGKSEHLKISAYTNPHSHDGLHGHTSTKSVSKKGLTVGSLKQR